MHFIDEMFHAHPHRQDLAFEGIPDCVKAVLDCATTCAACADACLAQPDVQPLVGCIRLNLDCAAICRAAGEVLSRSTEPDWRVVRALVEATERATQACAVVCEQYSDQMAHCRVCAEACRDAESSCRQLLALLPTVS